MGNQPSRKITRRGKGTQYSRKSINDARSSIKKKNYKETANIVIKASLENSGKNSLAASVLAGAFAYTKLKDEKNTQNQKIISSALTSVIKKNKLDVSPLGRNIIKSSITEVLSSEVK